MRHEPAAAPNDDDSRFKLLVDSVADYAIFLLSEHGIVQSWNQGAQRIKGYTAAEIVGRHFSAFYLADDVARHHPDHELAIAKEVGRYEEEGWRVRKDGTHFWANIVITALRDPKTGQLTGFAKVTRDLTERRASEEALRRSEERNRLMFESVRDYGIFMLDPHGIIENWNEGARRIKGYEASEIVGQHFSVFYVEDDVRMGKCDYELQQAEMTGRFEDEGWRRRKDGTLFWANVVLTAVRDPAKRLLGFLKVTRDITERRQAEEKLRLALEHLERRVGERTVDLEDANNKLQVALSARDEFLSIASHELRTPVTPLGLQLQALAALVKNKQGGAIPAERVARTVVACERAVTRLSGLINNLLDVSRISIDKLEIQVETVELHGLLREVADRYRQEASDRGVSVTVLPAEPVHAAVDRLRMEQVVTNLLTNAIKYGDTHPVELALAATRQSIDISVRDHGPGISHENQSRIFERFERASTDRAIGGMGLGLYITQQIVEAHGGSITLKSEPGQGALFTVSLPR